FNSPYGACPECDGLGYVFKVDRAQIIPDPKLSIMRGGLAPLGEYRDNWTFQQLKALAKRYKFSLSTPLGELADEHLDLIFNGAPELITVPVAYNSWNVKEYKIVFEGIFKLLEEQSAKKAGKEDFEEYRAIQTCPECRGARLKKEALHFKI